MKRIGVTGGIGSGKSIVCKIFSLLGVPVYNADDAARRLMNSDTAIHEALKKLFGSSIIINGVPDRVKIASSVFENDELLNKLNNIVHPAVFADYELWEQQQNTSYTIREAAILFESGLYLKLDHTILVDAPEAMRIERVKQRDGRSAEAVKNIIQRQWTSEKKKLHAWRVINNDETELVIPQVLQIHNDILND